MTKASGKSRRSRAGRPAHNGKGHPVAPVERCIIVECEQFFRCGGRHVLPPAGFWWGRGCRSRGAWFWRSALGSVAVMAVTLPGDSAADRLRTPGAYSQPGFSPEIVSGWRPSVLGGRGVFAAARDDSGAIQFSHHQGARGTNAAQRGAVRRELPPIVGHCGQCCAACVVRCRSPAPKATLRTAQRRRPARWDERRAVYRLLR
jgi:hypothetical protein